MQFHLDGFRTGDPRIAEARADVSSGTGATPGEVDVLIIGCGPAGLTLAAQLAAFPEIATLIVDQKDGPLQLGQADGIACRTLEMFEAFGFSERVLQESYWVNETTFWKPDPAEPRNIARHGRVQDVEDGLSEFPHVILNQARIHDFYLDIMRSSPRRLEPRYSRRMLDLSVDDEAAHPISVRLERLDGAQAGEIETVRARYVVGCDGARSAVRKAMGRSLEGDSANKAWGVMDVLAVTDFPDVRLKALIQSAGEGSILIIPREGGYLIRIYVELDKLRENERVASRNLTVEHLIAAAQRILHPYSLDVREVAWWSVYDIGQRLCAKFDDVPAGREDDRPPRVFITGDACHTHSPKAGQGMNVSMQDSFNLGWKLAAVLRGRSDPALLHSYSAERQAVARELIDFDREWARMLSTPMKASAEDENGTDAKEVEAYFVRHGRYTAGTATQYPVSPLTAAPVHAALATGLPIGKRFHSAPVVRLADARPMQLGHAVGADGRWRLFLFADGADPAASSSRLHRLCAFLDGPAGPLRTYTPAAEDIDSVIDVRAVLQQEHRQIAINAMPALLLPAKGKFGLTDYEKIFCADHRDGADIFAIRGIDRGQGCIVIVRPDQFVANILPLTEYAGVSSFFSGVLLAA